MLCRECFESRIVAKRILMQNVQGEIIMSIYVSYSVDEEGTEGALSEVSLLSNQGLQFRTVTEMNVMNRNLI